MWILQARILELVSMPSSRGSSQPRDWTQVLYCRLILYLLSHQGSPRILEWIAYAFSRGSSQPRNWTRVSFIKSSQLTCSISCYRASLIAQLVKNLPAMWDIQVRSLGREDSREEGMATHSSILAWRIHMDRGAWQATVHGVPESWTQLSD